MLISPTASNRISSVQPLFSAGDDKAAVQALKDAVLKIAPSIQVQVGLGRGDHTKVDVFTELAVTEILKKLGKGENDKGYWPEASAWHSDVGVVPECAMTKELYSYRYVPADAFVQKLYDQGVRAGQIRD